ncbi:MAG: hypothetical protein AMXMBFR13_01090 [Phycisphaerae bacterium]
MKRSIGWGTGLALVCAMAGHGGSPMACAGTLSRVSLGADGAEANNRSLYSSVSADGRYVAFSSEASNLVPDDDNQADDIFVRDRLAGLTVRLHPGTTPVISADGSRVAYVRGGQVYLTDRAGGDELLVSRSPSGEQGNGACEAPAICAQGRFIAFASLATNLLADPDTNNSMDVFVFDRLEGTLERVSVSSSGTPADDWSYPPSISLDGRYVAFESDAANLITGDTNGQPDVFLHDRWTATTQRVSLTSAGAQANGWSLLPSLSGDGRYVAFLSFATNLVAGDTNGLSDVFVRDRVQGTTVRVSVGSQGQQGDGLSGFLGLALSADGRRVAFVSSAGNLVDNDQNFLDDILLHDRLDGTTVRVSEGIGGMESDGGSGFYRVSISAHGRHVCFDSRAGNLVPSDTNDSGDIFLYDLGPLCPPLAPDFNGDCDVDADDAAHLDACSAGPSIGPPALECADADLDGDADVDQSDFGLLQRCFSGPVKPADPACMP